jgi:hypothetical protein
LTFIPEPSKFTPIKAQCWDRQFGIEFNRWEWGLINDFNRAKKEKYVTISGSVVNNHRLGKGQFLLIPAPHLPQDQILCACPDELIPANNEYVTVKGKKVWVNDSHYLLLLDEIEQSKLKIPVRSEINFQEFEDLLFLPWRGLDKPVANILSYQFISCPPLFALNQVGGLVVGSYDGTREGNKRKTRKGKKLLNYFKGLLPNEIVMGKPCSVRVPWMSLRLKTLPYSWQYKTINADKELSPQFLRFMSDRKSAFSELSIGVESEKKGPSSFYDAPLSITDQPTILPDSLEQLSVNSDPSPDIIKYIMTQQLFCPTIGNTKDDFYHLLGNAAKKLLDLADSYDIPQAVRSHAVFDPNYYGKPQAILRIASSAARAFNESKVDENWVSKVFEGDCLKNYESILDWQEYVTVKGVETISIVNEFDRKVIKLITEKETKEIGVGMHQIMDNFLMENESSIRESLGRLRDSGKIYENPRDVFRTLGCW